MSDIPQMKKPWSVVGAGFNDEGVYFTFDDNVIDRRDVNLMQAAPELLEALQAILNKAYKQNWNDQYPDEIEAAQNAISKALGQ